MPGELYSVKIMWPRTVEEKNRRRNTGFVCFMNRDDAEEAMHACDETDPFNNGRLLTLRWGKNVKKKRIDESVNTSVKKVRGSTRNSEHSIAPSTSSDKVANGSTSPDFPQASKKQDHVMSIPPKMEEYDPKVHALRSIRVEIPTDRSRFHLISTAASYVAKDPEIEQRLMDEEKGNSLFNFLSRMNSDDKDRKEKIFYKWRVYSFCQGDTYSNWRTKPFLMFSHGRYWIPPPLDLDAANKEKADLAEKERRHRQQKEDRANRELMTGRQFERRKRRGEFGTNNPKLNPEQITLFDQLVRKKLSLSRKTICEAMSFCFDNCVAAREVCALLKESLLDESDYVANDTRIARLYLLSDILFNSQQPGVKNAFMYRTTIESMAGTFFREFGNLVRRKEQSSGRITVNRLRKAVSAVLGAWTEWGVYNATFVDELEAHFEGREVKDETNNDFSNDFDKNSQENEEPESSEEVDDVVIHGQRGDWKEVSDEINETKNKEIKTSTKPVIKQPAMISEKESSHANNEKLDSVKDEMCEKNENKNDDNSSDVDGEDLCKDDIDGEDLDGEDLDGEDLEDEDFDGA